VSTVLLVKENGISTVCLSIFDLNQCVGEIDPWSQSIQKNFFGNKYFFSLFAIKLGRYKKT
jgi:hypothetical protein